MYSEVRPLSQMVSSNGNFQQGPLSSQGLVAAQPDCSAFSNFSFLTGETVQ